MPVHLRPMAPVAADAIVCGDPARALYIAELLLIQPRMSNHHRGLWGYHGEDHLGRELSVHATGIGGPSAAIVIEELAGLGLRRLVRIGSCRATGAEVAINAGFAVSGAICLDGTSVALGAAPGSELGPDPALGAALRGRLGSERRIVSRDVHGSGRPADAPNGVVGSDLQTAAVFAAAAHLGLAAAAALLVVEGGGMRLEDDPLEASMRRLAVAAGEALGA